MRPRFEFASRFRILKGGKISLIVSALVTSVTLSFASPSGGVVTSGNANISQSGTVTNINQSTSKASINWNKFNIARDETVNFNQPNINSITLNRVIGNERSIINGALNANGQVWILNSNGVLFGKNASVNTSGLLATTASLSDEAFQAGAYHFKNATSNTIINEGTIKVNNSSYVILASNETRNTGSIEAVKAKVHLVGANEYSINLNGNSLVDLTIEKGVMDALVENSGTIINKAGEIYLTTNAVDELLKGVVNHTGILEANSLDEITGKVELFAHGGEVQVGGTIKASEGFVETSGKDFKILDNATIEAGKWLIDPTNLTVDDATAYETSLNNGTSITIQTDNATGSDEGNININDTITWTESTTLTLDAYNSIYINEAITATQGSLALNYSKNYYINAPVNLPSGKNFITNGTAWTVINDFTALQNMTLNNAAAHYVLGSNLIYDKDSMGSWDPIGGTTSFIGNFDGNGHTIDALYINRPNEAYVGLFGAVGSGGTVTNIGLTNVDIIGKEYVGGLVGFNIAGTITNSYATGSVRGDLIVGDLVGFNFNGTITNSYATGSVRGDVAVGGLVGYNQDGTITNSYATGSVSGTSGVGGLVGKNVGTITSSYWDIDTSGQSSSSGGTGLTTEQFADSSYFSTWDSDIWRYSAGGNLVEGYEVSLFRPYLINITQEQDIQNTTLFASGWGTEASPYAISTWAQLANIDSNSDTLTSGYYYTLSNNLTTSTTGYSTYASSSANGGLGWDPIGDDSTGFRGTFDGNDYVIDSLYINRPMKWYVGLFGDVGTNGTVTNIGLTNVDITGCVYVGALAGDSGGDTTNVYSTGSVNGNSDVGGLVGSFYGLNFTNSYSMANVTATGEHVGGLVGSIEYDRGAKDITNSYATGDVSGNYQVGGLVGDGGAENSYATGDVSGSDYVGGLVGYVTGDITNSYSIGKVTGTSNVGGLIGYNDGETITSSYWDKQTSGQSSSAGGTGLTTAQMGYGKIFNDSSWNIEIDHILTSGNAPLLRYNDDGSATWIIATLTLSYTLTNQTVWTYDGISYSLSSFYNDSALLFGSDYSFIDSSDYNFIDGSDSTITSVRNAGTYTIGLKSKNSFLSMASTGNTKATIKIDPKVLSATYSADDKIYDGTTTATVSGSLDGDIISGDKVSLLSQSANFEDKNVGENKQVNITNIILSGDDALNYILTSPTTVTTSATINKKEITATYSADDKTYDGTTLANVNGSLVDAISGDSISLMQNANYIDKNVGSNKQVNITNIALSGNDALNYTLTSPTTATTSANINKKGITAIYTAEDKTYDGTTLANVSGSLSDVISGDSVSLLNQSANFEDKNAGSNKQVNITNIALSGNDALNYTLISPTTATTNANINKKEITATYSANDKTYDGTTLANVSGSLSDVISGDSVSINHATAKFADKNAGENKQVNITNIALSGDDALNYVVSDTTTSATINKKEITATYSADDKTYDGTILVNVSGSLDGGIISGDSVSLLNQSANFEDKNIGENKQVNITNIALSGDDALNYVVSDTTTTNANITPKVVEVRYSADDKSYDKTNIADIKESIEGILKGDKVSFIAGKGYFKDSIPGTNKTVYIEGFRLEGKDSKNYVLDADSYTTIASINIDLEDIIGSITNKEEYKIKNHFIHFNPIKKEIVLEIINGGIKLPKTVMTQSSFFNDSDNKKDEI